MIKFKCVNCEEVLEAAESISGEIIKCPVCKENNLVPRKSHITNKSKKVEIENVATVEQTSKKWKIQIIISVLMLIIGIIICYAGINSDNPGISSLGLILAFIGFIYLCVVKYLVWWYHK